ncbi:DUF1697 domain-containing protein [Novosphingobium sp. G106]|uniref:DUF1697 domain-containing protein n=1 Tax=Novosphingobium sp. G106 TaxID=2849500 RepID=UPI001C2D66E3|nr:DUF1697 domain-containing protein [Novosphingobium sp. G106]MBV1689051.1 DUF1697 domain-containing protein [Novosphingobium sp. G106]
MSRYIALFDSLRIGAKRLTMAELRAAFEAEGCLNIETVVAGGNILFDHPERPDDGLEEMLSRMMRARFGMTSVVLVRSSPTLAAAIADNPFAAEGEEGSVHTLFLDGPVDPEAFALMQTGRQGAEQIAMGDRALHIDYVSGAAEAKQVGAFIERRLGLRGTARSLRSMKRMLAKMVEV